MQTVRAAGFLALLGLAGPTWAETAPAAGQDFTLAARETLDLWDVPRGGLEHGATTLNKLQVSGTWTAAKLGDPNFRLHLQVFQTNGERLTSRVGDLQTVSNIEAVSTSRLFEAWAEQSFGTPGAGSVALRLGLIDLNSDFDSITPASLFLDSSNGIGPDLSKSGRNGPSIFPVSSAAFRLTWTPTDTWTLRAGLFDGVPGDPDHPKAFAATRVRAAEGALGIGEADYKVGKDGQISFGAWQYSKASPSLGSTRLRQQGGVFAFVEGPIPTLPEWNWWVRFGYASEDTQEVSCYLGAGVVKQGILTSRPDDRLGLAFSRAMISPQARRLQGLHSAESTIEATYQVKIADWAAVQPDVQYVVHPASQARIPNALVVGIRFVFTAGYPKSGPAIEQSDPTVPPDVPADK